MQTSSVETAKNQASPQVDLQAFMKFQQLLKSQQETPKDKNIKVLQGQEKKLSIKNTLDKYLTKSDKDEEELDADRYIQNNLEKNKKLREEIKQKKHINNEKLIEKELIQNLINSKEKYQEVHQTPPKKSEQSFQSTGQKSDNQAFPHHITGSMRKIRNSPALAENEQVENEDKEQEYSPNSIVPNNSKRQSKVNSICQLEQSQEHSPVNSMQQVDQDEQEDDFEADPGLLDRLNENMRKNDAGEYAEPEYVETDHQRKKRLEREKVDKQREEERQKLFDMFNNPNSNSDFWGGGSYEDGKNEDHENVSVNSITGKCLIYNSVDDYNEDHKQSFDKKPESNKAKYMNHLNMDINNQNNNPNHNNSYK